eukprot:15437015-Alexandrium_andersonii.AAC.1
MQGFARGLYACFLAMLVAFSLGAGGSATASTCYTCGPRRDWTRGPGWLCWWLVVGMLLELIAFGLNWATRLATCLVLGAGILHTLRRCIYDHIACRSGSGAPDRQGAGASSSACISALLGGLHSAQLPPLVQYLASTTRCVPGRRSTGKRPLRPWRASADASCVVGLSSAIDVLRAELDKRPRRQLALGDCAPFVPAQQLLGLGIIVKVFYSLAAVL